MISEYTDHLISPYFNPGSFNLNNELEPLALASQINKNYNDYSKNKNINDNNKIHIIYDEDVIMPVKNFIKKIPYCESNECDFKDISIIDKNIKKNTAFAYCEYPSARFFRSYDFEQIYRFLSYFKIKLACGLFFANPAGCDYSIDLLQPASINGSVPKIPGDYFKNLTRASSNAGAIYDIILQKNIFKNLKIIRLNSSKHYIDYKNNRKLSKTDGMYINVSGETQLIKKAYNAIIAAINSADETGGAANKIYMTEKISGPYKINKTYETTRINDLKENNKICLLTLNDISDYCRLAQIGFNYALCSFERIEAERFIIKAGINDQIVNLFNKIND